VFLIVDPVGYFVVSNNTNNNLDNNNSNYNETTTNNIHMVLSQQDLRSVVIREHDNESAEYLSFCYDNNEDNKINNSNNITLNITPNNDNNTTSTETVNNNKTSNCNTINSTSDCTATNCTVNSNIEAILKETARVIRVGDIVEAVGCVEQNSIGILRVACFDLKVWRTHANTVHTNGNQKINSKTSTSINSTAGKTNKTNKNNNKSDSDVFGNQPLCLFFRRVRIHLFLFVFVFVFYFLFLNLLIFLGSALS